MILLILFLWAFIAKQKVPETVFLGLGFVVLCCFLLAVDSYVFKYLFAFVFVVLTRNYLCVTRRDLEGILSFLLFLSIYTSISVLMFSGYFPIGERPRDWALLKAGFDGLVEFREPWFSGHTVKYYVFWYLYYGFLLSDIGLDVSVGYSVANGLVMTFASVFAFRLFSELFPNIGLITRLFLGFIALNLPNLKTVFSCFAVSCSDPGVWWSVSRTVAGGITEYPLWSFILGDLHPHYLSTPAIVLFLYHIIKSLESNQIKSALGFIFLALLYSFASNLWEVIFWVCGVAVLVLVAFRGKVTQPESLRLPTVLIVLGLGFLVLGYTYQPIKGDPVRLVNLINDGLKFSQTFTHFGALWIGILAGVKVWQHELNQNRLILLGFLLGLSLGLNSHFFLSLFLGIVTFLHVKNLSVIFLILLGLSSTMVPDLAYVDDPYGPPDDRLNTIFKTFYPAYLPLALASTTVLMQSFRTKAVTVLGMLVVIGYVLNLKGRVNTGSEPFAEIEKQFPNTVKCLQKASRFERSVILESEETPYSWDSFFCTASGNTCYLGWSNHVGLLYRDYAEIERRKDVTRRVYEDSQSCDDLRRLLKNENIDYIFVGPLEKSRYSINFDKLSNCLNLECEGTNAKLYHAR